MRGGARARSGPAPDPDALRRERDGDSWITLPVEGRKGKAPAWPLSAKSKRETTLWNREWKRPQAIEWERNGQEVEVALYVRSLAAAEKLDAPTNLRTLVTRQQEALGISLPSLREALKSLEALGVVEVRQGSGTYVGQFSLDAFVEGLAFRIRLEASEHRRTISELLEIRMILEQAYIRQIAAAATDDQVSALNELVDRMRALAGDGREFAEEDWRFHELLYRPVGNTILDMLVRAFWDLSSMFRSEFNVAPVDPAGFDEITLMGSGTSYYLALAVADWMRRRGLDAFELVECDR